MHATVFFFLIFIAKYPPFLMLNHRIIFGQSLIRSITHLLMPCLTPRFNLYTKTGQIHRSNAKEPKQHEQRRKLYRIVKFHIRAFLSVQFD